MSGQPLPERAVGVCRFVYIGETPVKIGTTLEVRVEENLSAADIAAGKKAQLVVESRMRFGEDQCAYCGSEFDPRYFECPGCGAV